VRPLQAAAGISAVIADHGAARCRCWFPAG